MKHTKVFPKSRVCVIDAYPSLKEGIQQAITFTNKHDIVLNSNDGRRIIFGFCLKLIEQHYKNTNSMYPKVLCISSGKASQALKNFIDNHFDAIVGKLPFPYCGKIDLESPDLEFAAQTSLERNKPRQRFVKLAQQLGLKQ